eukprot:g12350.t1
MCIPQNHGGGGDSGGLAQADGEEAPGFQSQEWCRVQLRAAAEVNAAADKAQRDASKARLAEWKRAEDDEYARLVQREASRAAEARARSEAEKKSEEEQVRQPELEPRLRRWHEQQQQQQQQQHAPENGAGRPRLTRADHTAVVEAGGESTADAPVVEATAGQDDDSAAPEQRNDDQVDDRPNAGARPVAPDSAPTETTPQPSTIGGANAIDKSAAAAPAAAADGDGDGDAAQAARADGVDAGATGTVAADASVNADADAAGAPATRSPATTESSGETASSTGVSTGSEEACCGQERGEEDDDPDGTDEGQSGGDEFLVGGARTAVAPRVEASALQGDDPAALEQEKWQVMVALSEASSQNEAREIAVSALLRNSRRTIVSRKAQQLFEYRMASTLAFLCSPVGICLGREPSAPTEPARSSILWSFAQAVWSQTAKRSDMYKVDDRPNAGARPVSPDSAITETTPQPSTIGGANAIDESAATAPTAAADGDGDGDAPQAARADGVDAGATGTVAADASVNADANAAGAPATHSPATTESSGETASSTGVSTGSEEACCGQERGDEDDDLDGTDEGQSGGDEFLVGGARTAVAPRVEASAHHGDDPAALEQEKWQVIVALSEASSQNEAREIAVSALLRNSRRTIVSRQAQQLFEYRMASTLAFLCSPVGICLGREPSAPTEPARSSILWSFAQAVWSQTAKLSGTSIGHDEAGCGRERGEDDNDDEDDGVEERQQSDGDERTEWSVPAARPEDSSNASNVSLLADLVTHATEDAADGNGQLATRVQDEFGGDGGSAVATTPMQVLSAAPSAASTTGAYAMEEIEGSEQSRIGGPLDLLATAAGGRSTIPTGGHERPTEAPTCHLPGAAAATATATAAADVATAARVSPAVARAADAMKGSEQSRIGGPLDLLATAAGGRSTIPTGGHERPTEAPTCHLPGAAAATATATATAATAARVSPAVARAADAMKGSEQSRIGGPLDLLAKAAGGRSTIPTGAHERPTEAPTAAATAADVATAARVSPAVARAADAMKGSEQSRIGGPLDLLATAAGGRSTIPTGAHGRPTEASTCHLPGAAAATATAAAATAASVSPAVARAADAMKGSEQSRIGGPLDLLATAAGGRSTIPTGAHERRTEASTCHLPGAAAATAAAAAATAARVSPAVARAGDAVKQIATHRSAGIWEEQIEKVKKWLRKIYFKRGFAHADEKINSYKCDTELLEYAKTVVDCELSDFMKTAEETAPIKHIEQLVNKMLVAKDAADDNVKSNSSPAAQPTPAAGEKGDGQSLPTGGSAVAGMGGAAPQQPPVYPSSQHGQQEFATGTASWPANTWEEQIVVVKNWLRGVYSQRRRPLPSSKIEEMIEGFKCDTRLLEFANKVVGRELKALQRTGGSATPRAARITQMEQLVNKMLIISKDRSNSSPAAQPTPAAGAERDSPSLPTGGSTVTGMAGAAPQMTGNQGALPLSQSQHGQPQSAAPSANTWAGKVEGVENWLRKAARDKNINPNVMEDRIKSFDGEEEEDRADEDGANIVGQPEDEVQEVSDH